LIRLPVRPYKKNRTRDAQLHEHYDLSLSRGCHPSSPFLVIPARDAGISFHFMATFVVKTNVRS